MKDGGGWKIPGAAAHKKTVVKSATDPGTVIHGKPFSKLFKGRDFADGGQIPLFLGWFFYCAKTPADFQNIS
jgi:hypothetical protein